MSYSDLALAGALIALAFVYLYPLLWMALATSKSDAEIFATQSFWPRAWTFEHFQALAANAYFDFWRSLGNSVVSAVSQAVGATGFAAAAAFALGSRPSIRRLALLGLGALMIVAPAQTIALPMFVWVHRIGLFDSIWGVALPGMISGLGLLFFERVYRRIPTELLEAARLEGAGDFRIWLTVLPLIRPQLIAFAFVAFALSWHAQLLPMLVLHSPESRTLTLNLGSMHGAGGAPMAALMAGSVICLGINALAFGLCFPFLRSAMRDFLR